METESTIVVAEDNPRDREFLEQQLSQYRFIMSENPQHALQLVLAQEKPQLLTDLQMPEVNGIELARAVWKKVPAARIIFWSNYGDETYIRSLSKIIPPDTVYGFVLKDNPSAVLNKANHAVFIEDQCWIDPKLRPVQARTIERDHALTDNDYDVLIDIALGLTDNLIAQRRYLSRRGAQNELRSLYQKLGVADEHLLPDDDNLNLRARAVSVALRRGLINSYELEQEEKLFQKWLQHQPRTLN